MDSSEWDQRYAVSELVWTAQANRWVVAELDDLPPGRAFDLACGEGRNALWLARQGWAVTGLEFSAVALDKARTLTEAEAPEVRARLRWLEQDLTTWRPRSRDADLVLIAYLHLPAPDRRRVLQHAADALDDGGTLLVIGHDRRNIDQGVGGPQDPAILYTPDDLTQDLADRQELVVEVAEMRNRPVDGADRPALDAVWRARRRSD